MGKTVKNRSEGGERLKKRIVVVVSAVVLVAALVAIWQFSAQNASESGALSKQFAQVVASCLGLTQLVELEALEHILRKMAHGWMYLILGLGLTGVMMTQKTRRIVWIVPLTGAALATIDEIHQSFVPGRGPSGYDVLIDTAGVCLGMSLMLFGKYCHQYCQRRQPASQKS